MNILVRRSNLLIPVTDTEAVRLAWRCEPDAVTLDLGARDTPETRALIQPAIAAAAAGASEIFILVNKGLLRDDLDASVWPGVRGIVLAGVDSPAQVVKAAEIVTALEQQRGIAPGSLSFIVMLSSARAVWDIRAIIKASPRVAQVGLDERGLAGDLGIEPLAAHDPFEYARGRLVIEAIAAGVAPLGIAYPLSLERGASTHAEIHAAATKARNLGLKGVLCPHPGWVAAVNAAFTPTPELVAYNRRVREAFAAGVAAGTAAVPLDGRMIDVPVDEWAIVVIATAEACARRDAEKRAALARLQA
jgi:citrate lyase subunit beta/citryl-CoA lyase